MMQEMQEVTLPSQEVNTETPKLKIQSICPISIPSCLIAKMPPQQSIPQYSHKRHCPKNNFQKDDEFSKNPWTEEEELKLIYAHKQYKNRWTDVAIAMNCRNNNNIKNRFYSIFRKIKGKIYKKDFSYSSKLELLEIHYMISLMLKYLAHPPVNQRVKGKRGKDFIFSLIHNLDEQMVKTYYQHFSERTKSEGTMESLFGALKGSKLDTKSVPDFELQIEIPKKIKKETSVKENEGSFGVQQEFKKGIINDEDKLFANTTLLKKIKSESWENSPLFGNGALEAFEVSPNCLSAGPAAAAASFAACYNKPCQKEGFSEFTKEVKIPQSTIYARRNLASQRSIYQPLRYYNSAFSRQLLNKPYFQAVTQRQPVYARIPNISIN